MARNRLGLAGTGGASTLARDLGGRAAEVDVDVVDPVGVAQLADRLAEHHRIAAVDLQAARLLVGAERHHPLGLGVAVHDRRGHDHLVDVDQARGKLRHNVRNGALVTPAIGANTTGATV